MRTAQRRIVLGSVYVPQSGRPESERTEVLQTSPKQWHPCGERALSSCSGISAPGLAPEGQGRRIA
eukprot:11848732-Alexandrium_andersonii.AAC.1